MVRVEIIRRKGDTVLIRYFDNEESKMVIMPTVSVSDQNEVEEEELELAIPYGMPWEEIAGNPTVSGEDIAKELHRRGIWTLADLEVNMNAVVGALQSVYRLDASALRRRARLYEQLKGGTE